jgi:hypothetical protein
LFLTLIFFLSVGQKGAQADEKTGACGVSQNILSICADACGTARDAAALEAQAGGTAERDPGEQTGSALDHGWFIDQYTMNMRLVSPCNYVVVMPFPFFSF